MSHVTRAACLVLCTFSLLLVSPVPVNLYSLDNFSFQAIRYPSNGIPQAEVQAVDFDQDQILETLQVEDNQARIYREGQPVWQSPTTWQVKQANIGDLNKDNKPEAVLLVRRPFSPWPIDRFIPNSGRINDFHDQTGFSYHIILIGWAKGHYREAWAGSALSEPVHQLAISDVNQDGFQELITLDGRYEDMPGEPALELIAWEWNGFGFSQLAIRPGNFNKMVLVNTKFGNYILAELASSWR